MQEEVIVEELSLGRLLLSKPVSLGLELLGYNVTIFFLKCNEGINWPGQLLELAVLELRDLVLNFAHLVVTTVHNMAAAKS